ncbi:MAG: hypothetical protein HW399_53 [Dehalococcoidia bacterium]|nr:hypothetical protein [Dehalococcoidia bacterium]
MSIRKLAGHDLCIVTLSPDLSGEGSGVGCASLLSPDASFHSELVNLLCFNWIKWTPGFDSTGYLYPFGIRRPISGSDYHVV